MAKKGKKYSDYDLCSLLSSIADRVALTIWREEMFGETEFLVTGNYKEVSKITIAALQMVESGSLREETVQFIMSRMFPKVDIARMIEAIKNNELSYQNMYDSWMVEQIEEFLPEMIDYFVANKSNYKKFMTQWIGI